MKTCLRFIGLGVTALLPMAMPGSALAAPGTLAVTGITVLNLGKVGGATVANGGGATTFTIDTSGGVSKSGQGGAVSSSVTPVTVTVKCSGGNCNSAGNGKVTIIGSPTGRAQALANFTINGSSATITSSTSTTANFSLPNNVTNGGTETFNIGFDFPIAGDSSTLTSGGATSLFRVQVATGASTPSGTAAANTGTATATVYRGLSVSKNSDLKFGSIVLPPSGSGTVTLDASTGALSVAGGALAGPTTTYPRSRGLFTYTGEGATTVTLNVSTFAMVLSGTSLTVTPTLSTASPATLSGSGGGAGSLPVGVGGVFTLSSTTPLGTYTGTFTVTAAYN
jgi:hypothetical protein